MYWMYGMFGMYGMYVLNVMFWMYGIFGFFNLLNICNVCNVGNVIYWVRIRWKRWRILHLDEWWMSKFYEEVHMADFLTVSICQSQCDFRKTFSQVHEQTWSENQEIQDTVLCEKFFREDTVSWTPELVFFGRTVGHSEADFDFAVVFRFAESNYWLHKCLFSDIYSKRGSSNYWTYQRFQEWWRTMWYCSQIKENLIWSSRNRTTMVWKVTKWFVRSLFCDKIGWSLIWCWFQFPIRLFQLLETLSCWVDLKLKMGFLLFLVWTKHL